MTTTIFKFPNVSDLETTLHVLSDRFTMFSSIFFLQSHTFANLNDTRKQKETHNLIGKIIKFIQEEKEKVINHPLYQTYLSPLNVADLDNNIDNIKLYYLYCIYNSLKEKKNYSLIILNDEKILQHIIIENEKYTLILYYNSTTQEYKPIFTSQTRIFTSKDSVIKLLLKMYKKTTEPKNPTEDEYVPFEHSISKDLSIDRKYTKNVESFMSSIFYCFLYLLDPDVRFKSSEKQEQETNVFRDTIKTYLLSLYETQSLPEHVIQKMTSLFKDYPVKFDPNNEKILLHLNAKDTLIQFINSDDTTHGDIEIIPILEYMTNIRIYIFKSPDAVHIDPDLDYNPPMGFIMINMISNHEFIPVLYSQKDKKKLVHHPILFNTSDEHYTKFIKKLNSFYDKHLKQFKKSTKTKNKKVKVKSESLIDNNDNTMSEVTTTKFEEIVNTGNSDKSSSSDDKDDTDTSVSYEKFIIDKQNVKFEPWTGEDFTYTTFASNPIINYSPQEITYKLHNLLNTNVPYHNTYLKIFQEIKTSTVDLKYIDRDWYFPIISFNKPFYMTDDEIQDQSEEGGDFFYESIDVYIENKIDVKNKSKQNLYDIPIYNNANVNDKNYISIACNKMCVRNCFDSPCSKIPLPPNKYKSLACIREHVYDNKPVRKPHALEFYSVVKHDKINQRGFMSIQKTDDLSDIHVFDMDEYVNNLTLLSNLTQFDNVNVFLCYKTKIAHRIIEYDNENKYFILKSKTDDSTFNKYIFDVNDIAASLEKNNSMMYHESNDANYMYSKIEFFEENIAFLTNRISLKECESIVIPSASNYFDYLSFSKKLFYNVEHLYENIHFLFGIDKQHETDDISKLLHEYFSHHKKKDAKHTAPVRKNVKKTSQPLLLNSSELDLYDLKKHTLLYEDLYVDRNDITDLHKAFHIDNKKYTGILYIMKTYNKPIDEQKIMRHIDKIEKNVPVINKFHSKHEQKISTYEHMSNICSMNNYYDVESILKNKQAAADDKEHFGKFQMYNTLTTKLNNLLYIKDNLDTINGYIKGLESFNKPIIVSSPLYVHKNKSKQKTGFDESEITMISQFGDTYTQMEETPSSTVDNADHKYNNDLISDFLFNKLKLEIPKNIQLFISQHADSYLQQYLRASAKNKSDPKFDKQKQKQYFAYLQLLIVSALIILLAGYFKKNIFNLNKQQNSECIQTFSLYTPELYTILNLEGPDSSNSLLNYICCVIMDEYHLSQTYKKFLPSTVDKLYDNVHKMLKFIVKNNESLKRSLFLKLKKDRNENLIESTITNFRPDMHTIELIDSKNTIVKNGEKFRFSFADGSNRIDLITSNRKSIYATTSRTNEEKRNSLNDNIQEKNSCSILVKKIKHSTSYNINDFFNKNEWMYSDKILYDMDEDVINEKLFKNSLLLENAMRFNISTILNFIATYTTTNLTEQFMNTFFADGNGRRKIFDNIDDMNFNVIFRRLSNDFGYETQRAIKKTNSKSIMINTVTKNFPIKTPGSIASFLPDIILYNLDLLKHIYVANIDVLIILQLLILARSIHLLFYNLFNVHLDDTELDINALSMPMINAFSTLIHSCFNYIIEHFQSILKQENVNANYEMEQANNKRQLKELQLNLKDKDMNILYYEFSKINNNVSMNILAGQMPSNTINVNDDVNIAFNPDTVDDEGPDENNNPDADSDDDYDYDD